MNNQNPIGPEQRNERTGVKKTTFQNVSSNNLEKKFQLSEYGYLDKSLPEEYLIRITSIRNAATIIAPMQEPIQMRVESHWQPLVNAGLLSTGNIITQAVTGGRKSLVTKATSRRIWSGSSPMTLSVRLKFEASRDTFKEVVEPIRILQSMSLPSEPRSSRTNNSVSKFESIQEIASALDKIPALSPPGPTPFTTEGILNLRSSSQEIGSTEGLLEGLKGGDKILIEYGKFLTFFNVIVKEASSIFPIKFAKGGNPISGEINFVFETYEMMTVESFSEAFQKTENP